MKNEKSEEALEPLAEQRDPSSDAPETLRNDDFLDITVLNELRAFGGEDDLGFLNEVIEQFLCDAPVRITEIRQAIEAYEFQSLTKAAHALKGSARNVGAISLSSLCWKFEEVGRLSAIGEAVNMVLLLEQEWERTKLALQEELLSLAEVK